MATLQSNPVLEEALDRAFNDALKKGGRANLLALEERTCEVFVEYSGLQVTVELDKTADVFFHNINTDGYGKVKKGGPIRDRRYYIITFGTAGSIAVDERNETVRVVFKPSTARLKRTT